MILFDDDDDDNDDDDDDYVVSNIHLMIITSWRIIPYLRVFMVKTMKARSKTYFTVIFSGHVIHLT